MIIGQGCDMASKEVKRVTICLPADSLASADRLAETWSTTRSGVVVRLLKLKEQARVRALMKEGYVEMASENRRDAEEALAPRVRSCSTTVRKGGPNQLTTQRYARVSRVRSRRINGTPGFARLL